MGNRAKHQDNREQEQANKPIQAKNDNQKALLKSFKENIVTVASGDAGTGKSYLAGHWAGQQVRLGYYDKVVVTRPYVTMGKSTGFWPGDVTDKLMPFLTPIINNICDQMGFGAAEYALSKGKIEIQPLEAIRGMSFQDAILIVEEAQNTTPEEIKSIVTRIGDNTKLIFTGDSKQNDLKGLPGITYLENIVTKHNIPDVGIVKFTAQDIVRSGIVKDFVIAFDKESEQ